MSLCGLKPICEIQFDGFIYPAMNQIVSQAARITTRWNDDQALNLVIRVPVGGGIRAVEHHSESNEAYFAHTPGSARRISVLPDRRRTHASVRLPSRDAGHFLRAQRACTRSENVNPRRAAGTNIRPGCPRCAPWIRTSPSSGTVAALEDVLAAAHRLAGTVEVEVVDLRWIAPMDTEAVFASVRSRTRPRWRRRAGGVRCQPWATVSHRRCGPRAVFARKAQRHRVAAM